MCQANNSVFLVLDDVINNQGNQDMGCHGYQANSNQEKQDGGTAYYRKYSKSEEIIHDLSKRPRPKAEGKVFILYQFDLHMTLTRACHPRLKGKLFDNI